jgi:hypothetical protein
MTTNGHDLEAARAHVADILKFDILTATQELDNEQQAQEISRSFICEFRVDHVTRFFTGLFGSGHYHRFVISNSLIFGC